MRPSEVAAQKEKQKEERKNKERFEERIPWWMRFSLPHPKGSKPNKMDLIPLEGFNVYTPGQVDFAKSKLGLFLTPQLVHNHETSREDKNGTRRFNRISGCERHMKVTPRSRLDAVYTAGNWPKLADAINADPTLMQVFTDECPGTDRLVPILGVAASWLEEQFCTPLGRSMTEGPSDQQDRDTEDCVLCSLAWHTDGSKVTKGDKDYFNRTFSEFVRGSRLNQYYTVLVPSYTHWTGDVTKGALLLLEIKPDFQAKYESLSDDVGEDEDEDWPKRGHGTLQRVRFTATRDPGPTTSSVLGNWTAKKVLTWEQIADMNPDAVIEVTADAIRARLMADSGYYLTVAQLNDPSVTADSIVTEALGIFSDIKYLPNGCDFERVLRPTTKQQLYKELKYPMDKFLMLTGHQPESRAQTTVEETVKPPKPPEVEYNDSDVPF